MSKKSKKQRKAPWWRAFAVFVAAIVVFTGSCLTLWQFDGFQRSVCRKVEKLQTVCSDSNKRVSDAAAEQLLALFVGRLTAGGGPADAWSMFTSSYHEAHQQTTFVEEAKRLYWQEVIGTVDRDPDGFNQFDLHFRSYLKGPDGSMLQGVVQQFVALASLTYEGDDIKVADLGRITRESPPANVDFPRPTLRSVENVHRFPRMSSDVSMYAKTADHDGEISVGGQLTAMCNLSVAGVSRYEMSSDVGTWTRVPQGWILSSALDFPVGMDSTPTCDQSVIDRSY